MRIRAIAAATATASFTLLVLATAILADMYIVHHVAFAIATTELPYGCCYHTTITTPPCHPHSHHHPTAALVAPPSINSLSYPISYQSY